MKIKIKNILEKKGSDVVTIRKGDKIIDAVKLMNKHKIGSLLVLDKKKLVGIITERDLLQVFEKEDGLIKKTKVEDVMTKNLIIGLLSDDIGYAMDIMTKNKIRHLPIMERENIIGMISIGDVVNNQLDEAEYDKRYLMDYMNRG